MDSDSEQPATKAQAAEPEPNKPVLKAERVDPGTTQRVMRAQPVEPTPQPKEIRRAKPVYPADEIPNDEILKATPPPAADFDD